jgi:hypothetical protein
VKGRKTGRYIVATSLILVLGVPAVAIGFGEGRPLDGGQRNPSRSAYTQETEVISRNNTYSTRQSNIQDGDGGGAIYGCRSAAGKEPCLRGNNLKGGRAFEFNTTGNEGGFIQVANANGAPFQTNGTGLVTNLNAGKVGGKTAADLSNASTLGGKQPSDYASAASLLFAIVLADGQATGKGVTQSSLSGTTYTLTFNRDVSNCSVTASPVGADTANAPGVSTGSGANANQVTVEVAGAVGLNVQVMCA